MFAECPIAAGPGIKTAFAKAGALFTHADGLQRTIEKSEIRGVASSGMLCTASELRISDDGEGIIELPSEMETGRDLAGLLWDPVFELSLTPNLGHCMSALGIARELSAALQIPIHLPKTALKENRARPIEKQISVSVKDDRLCPRYMCRLIEGVKIGPSPFWLRSQLAAACGLKPINNAVDSANYIMMKFGQPLHAFDYRRLEGKTIEVSAAQGAQKFPSKFKGLDGVEREIPEGTILILRSPQTRRDRRHPGQRKKGGSPPIRRISCWKPPFRSDGDPDRSEKNGLAHREFAAL